MKKIVRITFDPIDKSLPIKLREIASDLDISVSKLIRTAISEFIKRYEVNKNRNSIKKVA